MVFSLSTVNVFLLFCLKPKPKKKQAEKRKREEPEEGKKKPQKTAEGEYKFQV